MQVRVKLIEDVAWMVDGNSGHGIVVDGSPDIGGRNLGMRPMELVLAGLGGCTAMDVISILRKQRQDVVDCIIEVKAQRAETIPKVFTNIELVFKVKGHSLNQDGVQRAVSLSAEKYCSVSRMLQESVNITHRVELEEA